MRIKGIFTQEEVPTSVGWFLVLLNTWLGMIVFVRFLFYFTQGIKQLKYEKLMNELTSICIFKKYS